MNIQDSSRYGAFELKRLSNRFLGIAIAVSVLFHLGLIGLYIFGVGIGSASEKKKSAPVNTKVKLNKLEEERPAAETAPPPPPPMVQPNTQVSTESGTVSARAGAPVAVPDALISPDIKDEFATKDQISYASPEGTGDGKNFIPKDVGGDIDPNLKIPTEKVKVTKKEPDQQPDQFMDFVEDEPVFDEAELQKNIKYPSLALRNNIEGQVVVKAWIDEKGKVVKTEIYSSDSKLLEEEAQSAVKRTTFAPGKQNGHAVGCTMTIPVKFILKQEN